MIKDVIEIQSHLPLEALKVLVLYLNPQALHRLDAFFAFNSLQ